MSGGDIDAAMRKRFGRGSTPRSTQYQAGWRAALMVARGVGLSLNPYEVGTPNADAWFAGYDEGLQAQPCACRAAARLRIDSHAGDAHDQGGVSGINVLNVLDRYVAERAHEKAALEGMVAEGRVADYERELADLTALHADAVKARACTARLITADHVYDLRRRAWDSATADEKNDGDVDEIGAAYEDAVASRITALANVAGGAA
ncbi:hypothetical protein [Luteimonas terrae]|uniref:Uncharacterized protein n=1 Tax=Luteimonas terrae TaxID=1530191 RepID=A0ABU1XX83_9GAMM|nr:hypothetical protein [Luteimonas terrae]MDR7193374.1 hypothetical protein [Luteimonas terrae]